MHSLINCALLNCSCLESQNPKRASCGLILSCSRSRIIIGGGAGAGFLLYDPHEKELRAEAARSPLCIDVADRMTILKRFTAARGSFISRQYAHAKKALVTKKLTLFDGGNNAANAAVKSLFLDCDLNPEGGATGASFVENGPSPRQNEAMVSMAHATQAEYERLLKIPAEAYGSIAREWEKSALLLSQLRTPPLTRTHVAARLAPVISLFDSQPVQASPSS